MKKTIIFLSCLLLAAPFAVAEERGSSPSQEPSVFLAQLQTPDKDQIQDRSQDRDQLQDQDKDQLQDQDKDQLRTRDKDQLQTPDQDQLRTRDRDQLHDRTQQQVDKDDPAYVQAMHQHQFREQNVISIQNMIQEAQMKGLPTEPMQNKVHEGIAKKADDEAIVRAVEQVQNRYEYAYQQARGLFNDPQQARSMGNRFAEANAAGLANEDAARIMAQLQNRTRNMNREQAFELADETVKGARNMARQGVSSTTVGNVYANALQHAYQARDMQTLQQSFANQARHGNPENVAHGFSQGIGQGLGAGGLSSGGGAGSGSGSGGSGDGGGSGGSGGSGGGGGGSGGGGGGSGGGGGGSGGGGGGM